MQKVKGKRRGCHACGGGRPVFPIPPDKCPCPCGWVPRPKDCDRVYTECRWEGLPVEECLRRREECQRRWEDWPFYRGPCPRGSAQCASFCTCRPVTAAHALLTLTGELRLEAGRPVGFRGDAVETDCVQRVRPGAHIEAAGMYLVTVDLNLPASPNARFYVTVDGDEVTPGSLNLSQAPEVEKPPRPGGEVRATFHAIVEAGSDSVIGLTADRDINLRGEGLSVSMLVMRIA